MNDPRITAYALNEMRGEEREKFEFDLAADTRTQTDLQQATEVVGALGQVMTQPGEGLEPQAREQLLREIAQNQKIFQRRRKIVRFAMPVALAAAASIVVLLLVSGGKTTQGPAVAAADGAEVSGDGNLSTPAGPDSTESTVSSQVRGIDSSSGAGRTIRMSETGRVAWEMRDDTNFSLTSPAVRIKPLIWDEELPRWGGFHHE
jgi:hypothetical protein